MKNRVEIKDPDIQYCEIRNNPTKGRVAAIWVCDAQREIFLTEKEIYEISRKLKELKNKHE